MDSNWQFRSFTIDTQNVTSVAIVPHFMLDMGKAVFDEISFR